MLAQTELVKPFADAYGPFAFGIVAFVVIIGVLSIVWQKVFKPSLDTLLGIAGSFERTTRNIDQATERLERIEREHISNQPKQHKEAA